MKAPTLSLAQRSSALALRCRDVPDDHQAWDDLYETLAPSLRYIARRIVEDRVGVDPRDLVHEGWLAILPAVAKYRSERAFTTYGLRCARWAMRTASRMAPTEGGHDLDEIADAPAEASELSARKAVWLKGAVGRLSPRRREMVRLHFGLNGPALSQREIATKLGVKRTTVQDAVDSAIVDLKAMARSPWAERALRAAC